ncbi:MAG: hypothetical protein HYS12_11755 [Planctomycetes bacterium]|nr:hypothetical protein [Planctomycetota bacterium]
MRPQGVGINYLEVCRRAAGESAELTQEAQAGIRGVLDGASPAFSLEYPCHSPEEQRWFLMTVTSLAANQEGAVISHFNITKRKQAEEERRTAHDELEVRV